MDISALIISLVSGYPWAGSAVVVVGIVGYLLTHIFPTLPKPATTTGVWPAVYSVLSFLAGNWGNAAPTVANLPAGTVASASGGGAKP